MPAAVTRTETAAHGIGAVLDWLRGRGRAKPREPSIDEWRLVQTIQDAQPRFESHSNDDLRNEVQWLRRRVTVERGRLTIEMVRDGFAIVNEALFRVHGFRFYPVQLLAGILLSRGYVAEMQTGEGKTLTAALPSFLLGLRGEGVHVATVNEYLAERDREENLPIFDLLGLSVGLVSEDMSEEEKHAAYRCDITYGTGYMFGFDYLRDQLALRTRQTEHGRHRFHAALRGENPAPPVMQRNLAYTIVDELDSVLIDDAATPLVLAGGSDQEAPDVQAHKAARRIAQEMVEDQHFTIDQLSSRIDVTEAGVALQNARLAEVNTESFIRPWSDYIESALRATHMLQRDVHYVVADDEVQLVDQTTGRIHAERKWRGGLHQAIQVFEDVPCQAETETLARITRQRFYQRYKGVSGMTGTAEGGERELFEMYGLSVVKVPTNRKNLRVLLPEAAYSTAAEKWQAVADDVQETVAQRRPVLIGTRTIADSEAIAAGLDERGIPYRILNGKQDAEEAAIIAEAGQCGTITIATNMAGRGTDIRLSDEARANGGLHVVAAEHHDSARIDRQLVGRAARQGDPGTARFYLAADDQLIQQFDPGMAARMTRAADVDGLIARDCSTDIQRLQQRVELYHFQRRREMYAQDRVQNEILRLGKQSL